MIFIVAFVASISVLRLLQPIGPPTIGSLVWKSADKQGITLDWPGLSQASIGTTADGILASKPGQTARPTASTAKLITALAILKAKPLRTGEQGPLITIGQQDLAIYDEYYVKNGSLASIQLGEQLSQYQMLQGILIRSANNFADSLAIWAFGSLGAYQQAAQKMTNELGMTDTTVGPDASGFNPATTSTAEDLTRLGIAAMKNDVVREIVRQASVDLPIDGDKPNTNWLLGTDGVVGIKTGTTDEAGGVFIIATEYIPKGEQPITLVGAVQGESTTGGAMTEARRLVDAAKPFFTRRVVVREGEKIADLAMPWGESVGAVASKDISFFGWQGAHVEPKITLHTIQSSLPTGAAIGTVSVGGESAELTTMDAIKGPSWWWRITANDIPNRH